MRRPSADLKRRRAAEQEAREAGPSRPVRLLIWAGICLALASISFRYLLASRQLAGEFGLPLDDGWIHARFAHSLAQGHGFSFNPGQPTGTTTSPLWTLLLGLGYRVAGEHLYTSIAINFLLAVLLCVTVYLLSLSLVPRPWLALGSAAAVAVTVPLPWWVLSGMEPVLYATLALLGILLHVRTRAHTGARTIPATIVFALAALARPEMLLLFPLAMLDRLVLAMAHRRDRRPGLWLRVLGLNSVVFIALVAPMFVYNLRVTGYPLPTSFYSKLQSVGISGALVDARVSWSSALLLGPLQELWDVWLTWARNNALLILPFFLGAGWLVREALKGRDRERTSLLIPLVLLVQPVAWALAAGYRPPDFQSQRYIADLNPLFVLLGMLGGWLILERVPKLSAPAVRGALFGAVLLLSVVRQPAGAEIYAKNVRDTTKMQVAIGRWVRDNVPPGSLLAVNDIGAIAYFSDMSVLDLQGLVSPEVLALRDMKNRLEGTAPQALFQYIVDRRPDYLIIFPQWYPDLDARRDLFTPVFVVALEDNITNGAPIMVVYRTIWAKQPVERKTP